MLVKNASIVVSNSLYHVVSITVECAVRYFVVAVVTK